MIKFCHSCCTWLIDSDHQPAAATSICTGFAAEATAISTGTSNLEGLLPSQQRQQWWRECQQLVHQQHLCLHQGGQCTQSTCESCGCAFSGCLWGSWVWQRRVWQNRRTSSATAGCGFGYWTCDFRWCTEQLSHGFNGCNYIPGEATSKWTHRISLCPLRRTVWILHNKTPYTHNPPFLGECQNILWFIASSPFVAASMLDKHHLRDPACILSHRIALKAASSLKQSTQSL